MHRPRLQQAIGLGSKILNGADTHARRGIYKKVDIHIAYDRNRRNNANKLHK